MGRGDEKADAFEREEMHDGARIVHRDKKVSRWLALVLGVPGLLTILLAIYVALHNASASRPASPEALPFVVAFTVAVGLGLIGAGVVFGVLRTLVTETAVHVKYGLWGPTIPLASIVSCAAVDYDFTEFGGWGIRLGRKGDWAYVASGTRAVEIRYREGAKDKRVLVGAEDIEGTVGAIQRSIEGAASAAKLRVEAATEGAPRESIEDGEVDDGSADAETAKRRAR